MAEDPKLAEKISKSGEVKYKKKSSLSLYLILAVIAILVLVVIGFLIYWFGFRDKAKHCPLDSPLTLTALPPGNSDTKIFLQWSGVTGPSLPVTYDVYQSTQVISAPSSSLRIATGVTGTSYNVSGLTPSTQYYFGVTSMDSSCTSDDITTTSAFTTFLPTGTPLAICTQSSINAFNAGGSAGATGTCLTVTGTSTSGATLALASVSNPLTSTAWSYNSGILDSTTEPTLHLIGTSPPSVGVSSANLDQWTYFISGVTGGLPPGGNATTGSNIRQLSGKWCLQSAPTMCLSSGSNGQTLSLTSIPIDQEPEINDEWVSFTTTT